MRIRHFSGLLLTIIVLLTVLGCASPPKVRNDSPPASVVGTTRGDTNFASVAGTVWGGTDSDGDYYEYHFEADGSLSYKAPQGFFKNGTWKQNGDAIYMETNQKFAERQGRISGSHMEGNAWNIRGEKWTWVADKM